MIYTTYFSNIKNLPDNVVPIAICGKVPDGWTGFRCKRLAPKWNFFKRWKITGDNKYYIREFNEQVLKPLNPHEVVKSLMDRYGENIALVCYERPDKFCHRHLVAEWLRQAGYEVEEYGLLD